MINTEVIKLNQDFNPEELRPAAKALRMGDLVAFPTETVYGLGANALLPQAVESVFSVKGRPQDNPLIIHLSSQEQLNKIVMNVPEITYRILDEFTPGPLTIILQKTDLIPAIVSADLDTVAIRFPANEIARLLIELAGVPIVAPSANLSGKPSPTKAWHVYQDLQGKIPYILDGGTCTYGLESTILDLSVEQPVILRPGIITAKDIEQRIGIKIIEYKDHNKDIEQPKAPGQKYRHYSPKAPVLILKDNSKIKIRIKNLIKGINNFLNKTYVDDIEKQEPQIGLFLSEDIVKMLDVKVITKKIYDFTCYNVQFHIESYKNDQGAYNAAHDLYNRFREFDSKKVDLIVCSAEPGHGTGIAYMNRLLKAAEYKI